MTVVVIGGDGFCGWATALRFALNDEVVIIDNESRRQIDASEGIASLTPIASLTDRIVEWNGGLYGKTISSILTDAKSNILMDVLRDINPSTVIHMGEQRSAPFSMLNHDHGRYTVNNNISVTQNVLSSLVQIGFTGNLVHLGSIGVYGYDTDSGSSKKIPEGFDRSGKLYPTVPGSLYHLTKAMDQQLMEFYARVYGLRITELHQGIVWGTQTAETQLSERLINRFDYDSIYGTVVNRFLTQAMVGMDLTVYGAGDQTRAFININDTVDLIHEFSKSEHTGLRIVNQITETASINELAALVSKETGVGISHIENPRFEKDENALPVTNKSVAAAKKTYRSLADLITEEASLVKQYLKNVNTDIIQPAKWK